MSGKFNFTITDSYNLYPCRAAVSSNGCRFSLDISNYEKDAVYGVAVFDKTGEKLIEKNIFSDSERCGNVYSKVIPDFNPDNNSYIFTCNDYFITDERAEGYTDKLSFGAFDPVKERKALFNPAFLEDDKKPDISYDDLFVYMLHVRGFTMHPSSGVRHKGTFLGMTEKIDHLKQLGVNAILLQPSYEFNENDKKTGRLNYWGYCRGYYYTPKSAYAFGADPSLEFADMVKKFHKAGIEVLMQMYFPAEFSRREIPYILEYWALKYHIDGFHVLGENIPLNLIDESPVLSDIKIFAENLWGIDLNVGYQYSKNGSKRRYGLYNEDFMVNVRRFLKGDPGVLKDVVRVLRANPADYGVINYLDSYNTFTLTDMVSYDYKHNENNGEDNRDGNSFNCSWNCGEEGPSKKPKINALRNKQIQNALILLFLASGVPSIFMGDEMGNSQGGNNNPYCQDNEVSWLDWKGLKRKNSMYDFIKRLATLRRDYCFYHKSGELSLVDICGCGFPELSYHGESAWMTSFDNYKNCIGILFCEKGRLFYLAVNMHWDNVSLSLPRPPKGYKWIIKHSTDEVTLSEEDKVTLLGRSIAEIVTEPIKEEISSKQVKNNE